MTDIVWSLRNDVPCNGDIGCSYELCNQAADEITRLRAEVAWHVEDKNAWQDTQAAHLREVTRLTAEVSELNSMFDARWSADMRAIECWRKVNPGNELVLPDHVDLSLWLMEERTRLTAEVAKMKHMAIVQEKLLRSKDAENEKLRAALHCISLGSQNSMTSKRALGKEARAALEEK
jgi:hypothetical protein